MRVLVVQPGPEFSVQDVYTGWVEALRELGQHVIEYDLATRLTFYDNIFVRLENIVMEGQPGVTFRKALSDPNQVAELAINGLYAALYRTRPDVVIFISAFFATPESLELVRNSGSRVVIVHTESPYEDDRQIKLAPHADINLLNDPFNIEKFAEVSFVRYVPHAYRPSIHHPGTPHKGYESDFAFVGTGLKSRIEFMEKMDFQNIDVLLAGYWESLSDDSPLRKYVCHDFEECFDNEDAARVYRSSKISMNIYRREAERTELEQGMAMGPREVEMAACGLFFLRDSRPEGDEVLPMLPIFKTPEEATDMLHWWLQHPARRAELANEARIAIADRTFVNNAKGLLRTLGA